MSVWRLSIGIALFMTFFALLSTGAVLHGFVGTSIDGRGECGMVFGAAVHRRNLPGPGIIRRIGTAIRLYNEGKIETLYLSGGKGDRFQHSEAEVMKGVALRHGVQEEDIVLEEYSRSTKQNIIFTKPLAQHCQSTVAISDRYHLARIGLLAEREGWNNITTFPADLTAPLSFEVRSVIRETLGYIYYSLYVDELWP